MMDKKQVADILEEIGSILEIQGANPFRVRAFRNGSRLISGLTQNLSELIAKNDLIKIKGIGKGLASMIEDLMTTGKSAEYLEIKSQVPEGVLEMLAVPGLGPKKVKALWKNLGIKSLVGLERGCLHGKVAQFEGFGAQTQRKIFEGIQQVKKHSGQFLYPTAKQAADLIVEQLKKNKHVFAITIAGSLRRHKEVVKDIDLVAATSKPKEVMDVFVGLSEVSKVMQHGETKSSVLLKYGIQADLRCVTAKEFPYALQHFTGSKDHNVLLRGLAQKQGLKMNEYGLFRGDRNISCKDEEAIYRKLGLDFIAPEMREGFHEIEMAQNKNLPKLIVEKNIRGIFHCHSSYSDGVNTIEEMVLQAKKLGLKYYGVADHSQNSSYAGGLDASRVCEQFKEIDRLQKRLPDIRIFKGMEADILKDGTMDMGAKVLSSFDYVVASVHQNFQMTEKEMTKRVILAVQNKYVRMLGHMTGRLLLSREGYALNIKEVIQACADYGVAIEINANPLRLDIDWRHISFAKEKGILFVINPDAHSVDGIAHYQYGVGIARKGGLTKEDVLNTRNVKEIEQWLAISKN